MLFCFICCVNFFVGKYQSVYSNSSDLNTLAKIPVAPTEKGQAPVANLVNYSNKCFVC